MTGTLDASWVVVRSDGPPVSEHRVVSDRDEVERLVAALALPGAADAYVTHSGRPAIPLPTLTDGDLTPVPDHVVYLAVWQQWGYFAYIGPTEGGELPPGELVFSVGDPDSTAHVAYTNLTEFPAGTGLSIPEFTAVVAQFLTTGSLPTSARWVAEENARVGRFTF
jgi:hypothetical protein